jgi:hypothetical protein
VEVVEELVVASGQISSRDLRGIHCAAEFLEVELDEKPLHLSALQSDMA